jgi:hypothetical protein
VKSWFYPAERIGYEFIYPKSQAAKIAADANTSVLAYNDDQKSDADENTLRGAQVGRIDGQGQVAADTTAPSATATTTTASTAPAQSNAPAAPAQSDPAPRSQSAPATTASANTTTTTAPEAASANRTPPASSAAASTTTASAATTTASADRAPAAAPTTTASPRATTAGANRAVGTSGSQAGQTATARNELPRTASPLAAIQLMSLALIAGGLGVRQLRRRYAANR